jgi:hypothetical protein
MGPEAVREKASGIGVGRVEQVPHRSKDPDEERGRSQGTQVFREVTGPELLPEPVDEER